MFFLIQDPCKVQQEFGDCHSWVTWLVVWNISRESEWLPEGHELDAAVSPRTCAAHIVLPATWCCANNGCLTKSWTDLGDPVRESGLIKCLEWSSLEACLAHFCPTVEQWVSLEPFSCLQGAPTALPPCGSSEKLIPALRIGNQRTVLGQGSQWSWSAQISVRGLEQCLMQAANQESFLMNCAGFHCRACPHWAFTTSKCRCQCFLLVLLCLTAWKTLLSFHQQDLLCNEHQDVDIILAASNPAIIFWYCLSSQPNQMVFECHSRASDCFLEEETDVHLMVSSSWFPTSSFTMVLKTPILTLDETPLVQVFYCQMYHKNRLHKALRHGWAIHWFCWSHRHCKS